MCALSAELFDSFVVSRIQGKLKVTRRSGKSAKIRFEFEYFLWAKSCLLKFIQYSEISDGRLVASRLCNKEVFVSYTVGN